MQGTPGGARRATPALIACCAAGLLAPAPRPPAAAGAPPQPADPADAVNVRAFGAKGDDATDDTAAIQAALDAGAGRTVLVPAGTYLVLADGYRDGGRGGVAPRSNTRVVLAPNAVLKARTTSASDYVVVRLERVSHVTIEGGTIQGERHTHSGRDGEWGFGIGIFGATDVVIQDVTLRDCWGDGLFIEESGPSFSIMARRITVRRVVATNNRRQGMSVLGVDGLTVTDSVFERTHGTAPSAGVDLEPGGYGHAIKDVAFLNCTFRDNAGRGIVADATTGADIADVRIVGGSSTGNGWEGVVFHRATGGALVSDMTVGWNGASGIYLRAAANITIRRNHVAGNSQRKDATFHGVHAQRSSVILLRDNVVRRESSTCQQRYGVVLEGSVDVTVSGNDLRQSGRIGDLSDDSPSRNTFASNQLTGRTAP
jgi:parallel beta-helix repeat protein